ncbi:TaqI-like C-terminal specificity domain-containing protein, partial [Planktothrix sp.]
QEFEQPKIIIPAITQNVEYAADFSGYYSNDKTSICVAENVLYILAILNSKLMWWFIQNTAAAKQGGFYEFKPMYVSKIPIVKSDHPEIIETLVNYILYLTAQLQDIPSHGEGLEQASTDKLMTSYFEQIVDALIYELYLPEELHQGDKYFMRHILPENLPKLDQIESDKMIKLRQIFQKLFYKDHPIRKNLFYLDSIEAVRIITGKR